MAELTQRYVVMAMVSETPFDPHDPEAVFVLKPWKDPAAVRALQAYRDNCYPELARDLDAWIGVIAAGPTVCGDVGRRNEPHVKAVATSPASGPFGAPARKAGRKARARRTDAKRKKRAR